MWSYFCLSLMDRTKILIRNMRGLNSSARQDLVRTIADLAHPDIVYIQDTKMVEVTRRTLQSAFGSDFSKFIEVPSAGASGGILVTWRWHIGVSGAQRVDNHSVTIQFSLADGQPWWLTCIYGPQGNEEKIQFLQELCNIRADCPGESSSLVLVN